MCVCVCVYTCSHLADAYIQNQLKSNMQVYNME